MLLEPLEVQVDIKLGRQVVDDELVGPAGVEFLGKHVQIARKRIARIEPGFINLYGFWASVDVGYVFRHDARRSTLSQALSSVGYWSGLYARRPTLLQARPDVDERWPSVKKEEWSIDEAVRYLWEGCDVAKTPMEAKGERRKGERRKGERGKGERM